MVRIPIIIALLFCSLNSSSQAHFELFGGMNYGTFKNESFNIFKDSYNEFNAGPSLQKELKPFGTGIGMHFGFAFFIFEGMGFSYEFLKFNAHTTAEFTNGTRHFEQKINCKFLFGFPFRVANRKLTINPKMGVTDTDILSYFEYTDGTKSYGRDKILNGLYTSFGFIGSLSIDYSIISFDDFPFEIAVGGSYTFAKAMFENQDWNSCRMFDPYVVYPDGLPLDYAQYTADVNNIETYQGGYVRGNLRTLNAHVTLRFKFGEKDVNL